jgi:hypothetical protein
MQSQYTLVYIRFVLCFVRLTGVIIRSHLSLTNHSSINIIIIFVIDCIEKKKEENEKEKRTIGLSQPIIDETENNFFFC